MRKARVSQEQRESIFTWLLAGLFAGASYYLYGTDKGARLRGRVHTQLAELKKDVIQKIEKVTQVKEDDYRRITLDVLRKYKKLKKVDPQKIRELTLLAQKHWDKL